MFWVLPALLHNLSAVHWISIWPLDKFMVASIAKERNNPCLFFGMFFWYFETETTFITFRVPRSKLSWIINICQKIIYYFAYYIEDQGYFKKIWHFLWLYVFFFTNCKMRKRIISSRLGCYETNQKFCCRLQKCINQKKHAELMK